GDAGAGLDVMVRRADRHRARETRALPYWAQWVVATARGWLIPVLAAGLVGLAIALFINRMITPEYRATAQLYLTPGSSSSGLFQDVTLGQSLARNYVQLVKADGVLHAAMDEIGWDEDVERFHERTQVAQVGETSIINVSFRDRDPQRAAAAANAVAN